MLIIVCLSFKKQLVQRELQICLYAQPGWRYFLLKTKTDNQTKNRCFIRSKFHLLKSHIQTLPEHFLCVSVCHLLRPSVKTDLLALITHLFCHTLHRTHTNTHILKHTHKVSIIMPVHPQNKLQVSVVTKALQMCTCMFVCVCTLMYPLTENRWEWNVMIKHADNWELTGVIYEQGDMLGDRVCVPSVLTSLLYLCGSHKFKNCAICRFRFC